MSAKAGKIFGAILYILVLLVAVCAKLFYASAGFDISLALLVLTTFAVAIIVFETNILVDDPSAPATPGDPPTQLSEDQKYEDKKKRAYWLLLHVLIFAAVAVLPFEEAPRTSCLILLTLLVIELASIAAKNRKDYEKRQTESMESIVKKGEALLPYLVGVLLLIATWQKFDGGGFIAGLYSAVRTQVNNMEQDRARERAKTAPNWGLIFGNMRTTRAACPTDDPLAGDQRVILHDGPAPSAASQMQQPDVLPNFSASVNNWSRPLDFVVGFSGQIALSPDSYIDISSPRDAVFVHLLVERSGAGTDLVLQNGICRQDGPANFVCTGSWRQGDLQGTYTMGVQDAGCTVHLYMVLDSGQVEVGQITIISRR